MNRKLILSKFDSIEAVTNQALDSFNRMKLSDAEDLYLKLIHHLKEIDNNKKSLIKCYEGLAEVYLKHASRLHVINRLEWQWMNIQAIILMQHAAEESDREARRQFGNDDKIWFSEKRDSILTKLRFHQDLLTHSLQDCVVFDERPDVNASLNRIMGRGKELSVSGGGWLEKLQTYCKNRLVYGQSNMGRVIEVVEPKVQTKERKSFFNTLKTADYFRERYHKLHQQFQFHTPTAIKYGLNQLDRSHSMSMNCIDRCHTYNTVADLQNQNVPKRPQSLNVKPIVKPSAEQQVKKAVEYLKKKAETLKKHFLNTPVVSWRGIIEQHKSILSETLDDFNVDYSFKNNGALDENDNCDGSDSGFCNDEGTRLDNQVPNVGGGTRMNENGNYVSHSHTCRTSGENLIVYEEDSIIEDQVEPLDTGFCRDRVVDPMAFAMKRGEKRKHGESGDSSLGNSSQDYSHAFSFKQTVYKEEIDQTLDNTQAFSSEYSFDTYSQQNKVRNLNNPMSHLTLTSERDLGDNLIEIETVDTSEVTIEHDEQMFDGAHGHTMVRRLGKYMCSQPQLLEDLSPHEMKTYRLHTFEECSPVTETSSLHFDMKRDLVSSHKGDKVTQKSMVLPINDQNIQIALAHSILLLADNLYNKEQFEKAASLYEKSLGLFHAAYKEGGLLDENMAYIMQRLGIIRTRNGDIIGGVGLMEQTMRMLNVIHQSDNHIRIAEVWYEMGNAYIVEHQHGETLRDHVILTIRDELKHEMLDYTDSDDEFEFDEYYNGHDVKNSYSISAYEALTCYQHALAILKDLENQDKVFTDLMAKVLTKLGDCSVIIDNYDRAVQYYEKALCWFPSARERSSLPSNAHVLCMLGVVRFMVHRYAKAAAMFQCASLMYQHIRIENEASYKFEIAYVLSLLSFSHYSTKHYYKATASALKALEIYTEMYDERIPELAEESFWLINQTIYTLGYAYLSVDSYERALQFLQLAKEYSFNSPLEDRVQIVLILKAIGDCYEGMENHAVALRFYCDALADNEENGKIGLKSSLLQNQLLSKTAGMHVSMQQYEEAAERLDQARDVQIDMEDDIRGDLVSLLHQLGQTHTLACEVDKAMECYLECVEAYEESHGSMGPEMSATYGNLATLCHVKACMTDDGAVNDDMLFKAENYYQIAVDLEFSPVLALKYANFLFHQESYVETIIILQQLLNTEVTTGDIIFSGIEQVVAPDLLQLETEEEEIIIPASVFCKYLLIVCYRHLGLMDSAEYCVLDLMDTVYNSDKSLLASILGYSIFELGIYDEARQHFFRAIQLSKEDYSVPLRMFCFCLCLELLQVLERGTLHFYEHYYGTYMYM